MPRYTAITTDSVREIFVLEDIDGSCGVFWSIYGPRLEVGDKLDGRPVSTGQYHLVHPEGLCLVAYEKGPISRAAAVALLVS